MKYLELLFHRIVVGGELVLNVRYLEVFFDFLLPELYFLLGFLSLLHEVHRSAGLAGRPFVVGHFAVIWKLWTKKNTVENKSELSSSL